MGWRAINDRPYGCRDKSGWPMAIPTGVRMCAYAEKTRHLIRREILSQAKVFEPTAYYKYAEG